MGMTPTYTPISVLSRSFSWAEFWLDDMIAPYDVVSTTYRAKGYNRLGLHSLGLRMWV